MADGQRYDPIADLRQQVGDEIVNGIAEDKLKILEHLSKREVDALISIENKYWALTKQIPQSVGIWGY
ncbi:MAG: hypothetical protein ACXVY5_09200 [Gaiellales bacterium]